MRGPQTHDPRRSSAPALGSPDLRHELRWLHALARRLAMSESDADDLVQETWMHAERTGPARPAEGRPLRAWLAGVLRNRERMQRRTEGRRRRREAEAAPELSEAAQAELVLHRDRVLSSLREVLDELDEDDRALLLARYCDEHAAPELADRLGLPASTVRSRLSRATTRVRQGLDERWGGDRRGWAPAILAAPMPGSSSAVVGTTGASMVSTKLVAMIVAVLIATTAGVWFLRSSNDGGEALPSSAVDREADEAARRRAGRDEAEQSASEAVFSGKVIDASTRRPIADAVVVLARASGAPGLVRPGSTPMLPRARTDVGGGFAIEAVPAGTYHVTAAAAGYLPTELEGFELASDAESPTLELRPGGNALAGVVTDIGGGPVAGTWVVARTRADAIIGAQRAGYAALTNDEGAYTLSLPDGSWTVEAGGDDYTVEETRLTLRSGPGRADFELVPAAIIRGRVVERLSGAPVAGAVVGFERFRRKGDGYSVDQSEADDVAVADANGNFTLRPLEPATYSLYASAPKLGTIAEAVVAIDIAEQVSDVVVTVDPAHDAGGFVVDATDRERGLGGIAVQVFAASPSRSYFATTAADGGFRVHGLAPGVYTVVLEGEGVIPSGLDHSLRVEAGGANDGIFALERGTSVRGRVTPARTGSVHVENREKSGGLEIMLAGEKLKNARARIGGDGSFEIEGVAPGAWRIVATADDGSTASAELDVAAQPIDDVRLELVPRASVRGRVLAPDPAALAGLTVRLQQPRPGPFGPSIVASATSDAAGRFELLGIEAGTYDVAVVDALGQPVAFERTLEPVVVGAEGVVELALAVRPATGRIDGRVQGPDGEPIADAFVVALATGAGPFDSGERTVITDAEGRFSIDGLADRRYGLHARGPAERGRVSLAEVAIGRTVDLVLAPLARVRGKVTMGGKPVERFTVESRDVGRPRTFIAEDGTFELDRVEPGKVGLAVATELGASSVAFVVGPGATKEIALELGTWGRVHGTLVDGDGAPIVGVNVSVHAQAGRRPEDKGLGALLEKGDTTTDAQGSFELDGIGPGSATLRFVKGSGAFSGEMLGEHRFTAKAGELVELGDVVGLAPLDVPKAERGSCGFEAGTAPTFATLGERHDDDAELHVFVREVHPGTPVEAAGLREGDRIVAIGGVEEASVGAQTLLDALRPARLRVGTTHTLRLLRDGQPVELALTVVPQRH